MTVWEDAQAELRDNSLSFLLSKKTEEGLAEAIKIAEMDCLDEDGYHRISKLSIEDCLQMAAMLIKNGVFK